MQKSACPERVTPRRLSDGAPNTLIVMSDDGGSGQPSTFGGEINTPMMDRIVNERVAYHRFHTTAICSPSSRVAVDGA